MSSPFDVLGVDPAADEEAVERAYRRRVKEAHPDHGGSAAEFRRVRAAYERIVSGDELNPAEIGETGEEADEEAAEDQRPEVEYLNYEVLADHGWTLADDDLFGKAADADLDPADHGTFRVDPDESLLGAAEECGFAWPFACRGGACANCAVAVMEGDVSTPVDHILPPGMVDRGIRLSCVGAPTTETKVVYNVKHLPALDELRLPPRPFSGATD